MRTLPRSSVLFAVLSMLLAATTAVMAQDEATTTPTWVTGSMQHVEDSCSEIDYSVSGDVSRHSYQCMFAWTSSDPRLTGEASKRWTEDTYQTDDGAIAVGIDTSFLQNEGGDWACSYSYLIKGTDPMTQEVLTASNSYSCIGGGSYEGLSAVLVSTPVEDTFADDFVGLIFSGDLPPVPKLAAGE